MARDLFGNKKVTREDKYTGKLRVTESDVRWEIFKMILWIVLGYAYFHFIIMGWTL